jgi:hypothetical protein
MYDFGAGRIVVVAIDIITASKSKAPRPVAKR